MTIGFIFWLLMLLWLVLGFVWHRDDCTAGKYWPAGGHLLIFVLLFLLGWKVFGWPIQG